MKHFAIGLGVAGVLACMAATSAIAQEFTIRIASPTTNDITDKWMTEFEKRVEERSNGRIDVQPYPSGQLGPTPSTVEGVAAGTIEISAPSTGFLASLEPRFFALDIPGLFDSVDHGFKVFTDPEVIRYLSQFGEDYGVEPLVFYSVSQLAVTSTVPIQDADDWKGLKIRTPGASPFYVDPIITLGASPISLPLGDALPALQTNVIDGVVAGPQIFSTLKFYDVVTDMTMLPETIIHAAALANRQFLKSLGPELETIVREEAINAYKASQPWLVEFNQSVEDDWTSNGGTILQMSPEGREAYLAARAEVTNAFLEKNPELRKDYEFLKAATERLRN